MLDKLHLEGKRAFVKLMQSIKLVTSKCKVLIMQSGIRQSVEFASRDTALLKGDWKLESTCEVALVIAFALYDLEDPIPLDFSCSHLRSTKFSQLATENREKSQCTYRITLRKIKPKKLDRSRILWP